MSDPAIIACWDADRLDLGRVGITPRADRLCTPHGRKPETIQTALALSRRKAQRGRRGP